LFITPTNPKSPLPSSGSKANQPERAIWQRSGQAGGQGTGARGNLKNGSGKTARITHSPLAARVHMGMPTASICTQACISLRHQFAPRQASGTVQYTPAIRFNESTSLLVLRLGYDH
jgi:hypothetical protein